ncbi:MAG TPA: hypothetical protein VGC09_18060 [Rhodopila sp.]
MRSPADCTTLVRRLVWIGLVLAVAAYGSIVVRNVTAALVGIASHQSTVIVAETPSR